MQRNNCFTKLEAEWLIFKRNITKRILTNVDLSTTGIHIYINKLHIFFCTIIRQLEQ